MKKIFFILGIALLFSCNQSSEYLIIGKVQNVPDSTVINLYQNYGNMATTISSDTIINGVFKFTGHLESQPSKLSLRIKDYVNFYGACEIWADYTKIEISGNGKYLSGWQVQSDVKEQGVYNKFQKSTMDLGIKVDSLILLLMNSRNDQELSNIIERNLDSIGIIRDSIEFELLKQNFNSHESVERLYSIAEFNNQIPKSEIISILNKMDTLYKNSLYGQGIESAITEIKVPEVGDKMVDIKGYDLDGKFHKLSDYKGNYILLDFWSMACYPCVLAAPELRKLNDKYKNNLKIVGINMEINKEMWKKGSERDSITWINLSDGKGTFAGAAVSYGINGFPTYVLINPEGIIVERWMGFYQGKFDEKIEKYFIKNNN